MGKPSFVTLTIADANGEVLAQYIVAATSNEIERALLTTEFVEVHPGTKNALDEDEQTLVERILSKQ